MTEGGRASFQIAPNGHDLSLHDEAPDPSVAIQRKDRGRLYPDLALARLATPIPLGRHRPLSMIDWTYRWDDKGFWLPLVLVELLRPPLPYLYDATV